ncbi:histidine kinase [Bradyrhizobium sp. LTSPM299]|uniref:sensor histidine kinase n=1 Tax=Bradyrhizobium sp. LTSPM299 TaxID=1619233 RepID=UPI0005C8AAD3|nr:MASE4 domain-containing protein [Bradyrhizobium sp. LTSPM299]KJC56697.1 histidine kinase [Bradyrhizobium sp. LTSPM299]
MVNTTAVVLEEQDFILTSLSPGRRQKRLALVVVLALLAALTVAPVSNIQLARVDAVVPAYGTASFVNDSITAVLLFAQFSVLRSRALLAIASGYVFTALVVVAWLLTFPGLFAPAGLLGAGLQTTTWLYILWHSGFPMFVIAYALLKNAEPTKVGGSAGTAILSSIAVIASVVSLATFFIIASDRLMPRLMIDATHIAPLWTYSVGLSALLSVLALIVLWTRWRSVLDLWLMVVMCAYVTELSLNLSSRFTVGWYASRACGLVSGSLVLFVLLCETTFLYAQLLRAVFAQRREREARLMTGDAVAATIAHEVKQPLTGMISNADAGLRWLERPIPDLEKAKASFKNIVADGHRAGAVIGSVRAIFKKDTRSRIQLNINDLIEELLASMRSDLQRHRINVQVELDAQVPVTRGDRIQLQQVLVNLITNAIDSMVSTDVKRILCVRSGVNDDGSVLVSIVDTGSGIGRQDADRIFDPLFTTKSDGMGMGLSICRSIIEAHDGRLWVAPNEAEGAVFHFVLPTDRGAIA